jgi:hypothetical protein
LRGFPTEPLDVLYFVVYEKDTDFNIEKMNMKKAGRYAASFPEKVERAVKGIRSKAGEIWARPNKILAKTGRFIII